MPNNLKEKLEKLSATVLRDAHSAREEIMEQTQREYDERLDKKETELLETAYSAIQKNIRSIKKDANERVLHAELDARKQLILKREEIIESVINEAKAGLVKFTESAEYENWLFEKTQTAAAETGKGRRTVYLSRSDMRFRERIEKAAEDITVCELEDRGLTGGVRVVNEDRKVICDYTLKSLLAEQKQKFLNESGLTLE